MAMIMVTTRTGDTVTERFVAFARTRGVAAQGVQTWQDVDLTISSTRSGIVTVDARLGGERVSAILNRMTPVPHRNSAEDRFQALEGTAAWWSAVAAFQGPVVNRPNAHSYLPSIHLPAVAAHLLSLDLMGSSLASHPPFSASPVARLVEQQPLGRAHIGSAAAYNAIQRYSCAERIGRVLVAGWRAFPLDDVAWPVLPRPPHMTPLFCVLTLGMSKAGMGLIRADAVPRWEDYAPLADHVHDGLLEALA